MMEHSNFFAPKRLIAVLAFFLAWGFVIAGRLLQFQILHHREVSSAPIDIYTATRPLSASRGTIYDSRMSELATTVRLATVVAEPRKIKDIPEAARQLAPFLGSGPQELKEIMSDPARQNYVVLKRKIDPRVAPLIHALGIDGVRLEAESTRVYPNRDLASHTLGFVDLTGNGVAGLEMRYNADLGGKEGKAVYELDALDRPFSEKIVTAPVQGSSLVLSIDASIQRFTQRELIDGVRRSGAVAGTAIVMESETGRILALANFPDFNCNTYGQYRKELWRNRAVQDQFEPGSTFKVVVASACLEEKLVKPGEIIDCQMGAITVGGHVFHDHKPHGFLTFEQILEQSSNVGAIKLGLRLGEERLYRSLRSFGFGSRTGIDLPAEAGGRLRDIQDWSALSIASVSFGQEVGATSIQILTAINAIANGGYRVRPSVVDRVINEKRETVRMRTPERVQIMRPETASEIRDAFEGAVLRGTGKLASLEGYRAAGKTGTAQKAVRGHFSKTRYVASFVGFAPLPKPRVTILIQIDEPRGAIYGGDVAAPVFQRIAQQTLFNLRVPQDKDLLLTATGHM